MKHNSGALIPILVVVIWKLDILVPEEQVKYVQFCSILFCLMFYAFLNRPDPFDEEYQEMKKQKAKERKIQKRKLVKKEMKYGISRGAPIFDFKLTKLKLYKYNSTNNQQLPGAYEYEKNWRPREGDILCLTFPKTGQTFLTHVLNQIRSRGESEGSLQSEVIWPTRALAYGQNLYGDQPYSPRIFKSHNSIRNYDEKMNCKFITIIRDPISTLQSLFYLAKMGMPDLNFEEFALHSFYDREENNTCYQFYSDFWHIRDRDDVLILTYEYILKNKEEVFQNLAKFMDLPPLTKEEMKLILEKTSKEWMFENIHIFDNSKEIKKMNDRKTPVTWKPSCTITNRKDEKMTETVFNFLEKQWEDIIQIETDFTSYKEFAEAVDLQYKNQFETKKNR